jgi:hypothetical protein
VLTVSADEGRETFEGCITLMVFGSFFLAVAYLLLARLFTDWRVGHSMRIRRESWSRDRHGLGVGWWMRDQK